MYFVFLSALFLIPVLLIAGLVYAFRKLSPGKFIVLVLLLIAPPFIAYKSYERDFKLGVVPDALNVSSISYSEEESWGFGPGGNEAGIRTYPIPEAISKKIAENGISYFEAMPPNRKKRKGYWQGVYSNWQETPIKTDKYWKPRKGTNSLNIYDYICRYGFCIDIKPSVVAEANAIVNSPGSYYAYGRNGLIIVNPERNLVLFIYNG